MLKCQIQIKNFQRIKLQDIGSRTLSLVVISSTKNTHGINNSGQELTKTKKMENQIGWPRLPAIDEIIMMMMRSQNILLLMFIV